MSEAEQKETSESRSPRPRFSLQTLLLLTTIVALGFGLWQVNRKYSSVVEPLRQELILLRNETGQLDVKDPDQIYIRNIQTLLERHTWEWRIHLPPKRKYLLCTITNEIPKTGIPTREDWSGEAFKIASGSSGLIFRTGEVSATPSGEFMLRIGMRKDNQGHWQVKRRIFLSTPNGGRISIDSGRTRLFEDQFKWLEPAPGFGGGGEFWQLQKNREPDQPIVLLRLIPGKDGKSPDPPSEGLMVWIEEAKPGELIGL